MTDATSFPPLHDPPPGELEQRNLQVLSRIVRELKPEHSLPGIPPVRARYVVAAVVLISVGVAAIAAVFGGKRPSPPHRAAGARSVPGMPAFVLSFARKPKGALTSLDVTFRATTLGGTARLQVVRGPIVSPPGPPAPVTPDEIVFEEQIPMTNLAKPIGLFGEEERSTWSRTLSPRDWTGGCQKGPYHLIVNVSPAHPRPELPGERVITAPFSCSLDENAPW